MRHIITKEIKKNFFRNPQIYINNIYSPKYILTIFRIII